MKTLLIISHAPSKNTQSMLNSLVTGADEGGEGDIDIRVISPLNACADDVLNCDAIILGTTENLGYMSGALKDFFDRIYYPCLEAKQGLSFCYYIRAGHDGTGTKRAIDSICSGLKWSLIQPALVCRGPWQEQFLVDCKSLGATIGCGLSAGIF
ncbi:MAG: flavodoxin family protein [Pseudomonadales bacterium]